MPVDHVDVTRERGPTTVRISQISAATPTADPALVDHQRQRVRATAAQYFDVLPAEVVILGEREIPYPIAGVAEREFVLGRVPPGPTRPS